MILVVFSNLNDSVIIITLKGSSSKSHSSRAF